MMQRIGGRKMALGLVYLLGCFTIAGIAVYNGVVGWEATGVASLFASISTGLGVVVWGNVKSHQARNGGGS